MILYRARVAHVPSSVQPTTLTLLRFIFRDVAGREMAEGRDDIRVEYAGVIAGWWFTDSARPA